MKQKMGAKHPSQKFLVLFTDRMVPNCLILFCDSVLLFSEKVKCFNLYRILITQAGVLIYNETVESSTKTI